ncbi:MAG: TonB-dependent receptor, partial [Pseudoxanthomonas sp.]
MQKTDLRTCILALAVAAALTPGIAAAQSPPVTDTVKAASERSAIQLDTVTVTAQRREEALQQTPVTITALSAEQLEQNQVMRIDDLKFSVPNMVIEPNTVTSSGAKIYLRGVGTDDSLFTTDPAVAIYIDDVYIPRQTGSMFDLYDVERIEVLRGPQGTLYGRNATGGAIRYITKKPNGESSGVVSGQVGNLGRADLRFSVSERLGESVDFTAAALTRNRDGIMRDTTNNRDVNDQEIYAARVGFGFPLGDRTRATVNIDRIKERSGPVYATGVIRTPVTTASGAIRPVNDPDSNYYTLQTDLVAGTNDLDQTGVALTLETDLGSVFWRNILHYRSLDNLLYADVDGTAQRRFHLLQNQGQDQRGFESQLISQGSGPFTWVGGLFAFAEGNEQPTRQDNFVTGPTNYVKQDTKAVAAYLQGAWRFDNGFGLTAGGRYSHEEKEFSINSIRANGSPNFQVQRKQSWAKPDWKLLLDYRFSDAVMAYGSAATGFKSGGFNGRAASVAALTSVDEESVLSYEIGLKSQLFDNRMRLNVNYYRNNYTDLQLTAFNEFGALVLSNATDTLIQGFEGEMQAILTENWQVHASVGTIDGEYTGYSDANRLAFDGKNLKQAPKVQWTIGTTNTIPVSGGKLVFSAQAHYSDEYELTQDNSPLVYTKPYTLIDARLAWEPDGGKWMLAAWTKNLTDEEYMTGGFDIAGLGIADAYMNVPRT